MSGKCSVGGVDDDSCEVVRSDGVGGFCSSQVVSVQRV